MLVFRSCSSLLPRTSAFHTSAVLCMKKKFGAKMVDPEMLRRKDERLLARLERRLREENRKPRRLKPVAECQPDLAIVYSREQRTREHEPVSDEELDRRALIEKRFNRHMALIHQREMKEMMMERRAQRKALTVLRATSEELYVAAMRADPDLLPVEIVGPVHTPPVPNYAEPDGDIVDVSRKWD